MVISNFGSGDCLCVQRVRALVQIRARLAELDVQWHTFCCEYILTFHTPVNEQVLALGLDVFAVPQSKLKVAQGKRQKTDIASLLGCLFFSGPNESAGQKHSLCPTEIHSLFFAAMEIKGLAFK